MADRPPIDPAVGSAALAEAEQARADLRAALASGGMTLQALFEAADQEEGGSGRVIGHMHLHSVLVSLPKIGEKKAEKILTSLGWSHDKHVDTLGAHERKSLIEAVSKTTG